MPGGDRRRIELAYSLQRSMPGTPVIRYGEEIGMGDARRECEEIGSGEHGVTDAGPPGVAGSGYRWIRLRRGVGG